MGANILIVDDDPDILTGLKDCLHSLGYVSETANSGESALEMIEQKWPDLILLDLSLPQMSGINVLQQLHKKLTEGQREEETGPVFYDACQLPVIVMTAYGNIENAVEAMKLGAYDFFTKPFEMDHLALVIEKALERNFLKQRVAELQKEVSSPYANIVGDSPQMQELKHQLQLVANSTATVLLLGETGTGKELFARTLHRWSPRHSQPFMVINCAALPEHLLESELFGHEKGAFTGADRKRLGKIEAAHTGTVFLDEIGDLPILLQGRLLRVLQDREIQRVGGIATIPVNVRFVAATNQSLQRRVQEGTFREDLFFRLHVLPLTLPPLRERPEDIPELADFFLARCAGSAKRANMKFSPDALKSIKDYSWPGNIRELENVICRAAILCPSSVITSRWLNLNGMINESKIPESPPKESAETLNDSYQKSMESFSRTLILDALKKNKWNKTKAAETLSVHRTHLGRMMKQKNIHLEEE
jgi:DNA-binding NtrC family response regulator